MAEETAQPVVSDEPVATPVGDTEGTVAVDVAGEQPQQQAVGADAADETPVVELSEDELKSWKDLPAPHRKFVNRLFTQKSQGIAEIRKRIGMLDYALEKDPDGTVEALARSRGFQVTRPNAPASPTAPQPPVPDEVRSELEAQFGEAGARAVLAAAEKMADSKAEARVKPYEAFHKQTLDEQNRKEAVDAELALKKEFPDYETYIPQMQQLAQKLQPGPGMTKAEYARILYIASNPSRTSAQTTNAVIQKLTRAANSAEAPAQAVPTQRVAKSRPTGLSFEKGMQAAAEAAARGEVWD